MKTYDKDWKEILSPDFELGKSERTQRLIAHHDATPEVEYVEEYDLENPIAEYLNGGKEVAVVVLQEYVPPKDAWDEYEDCYVYTPYTSAELEEIATAKEAAEAAAIEAAERAAEAALKAAEREAFLVAAPERVDTLETSTLDHDESITEMYESMTQAQLDTDEALVTIYESMTGATA